MKKRIVVLLSLVLLIVMGCTLFVACEDDKEPTIKSYTIEDITYEVGDEYKQSDVVIVAKMTDGSERKVKNNLVFVGDSAENLKLDDAKKFTEKGEYKVTIYSIEEREDYKIGEWTIKVV